MLSRKPRKQRKVLNQPKLHIVRKNMSAHLSKELRKKYKKRSFTVHSGDVVKVMRGKFEDKTGKVDRVNLKACEVFVDGIMIEKANGQKTKVPLHPSNLMITELNLSDKFRKQKLEGKGGVKHE
jgi:large subunit ribosomal protein L24